MAAAGRDLRPLALADHAGRAPGHPTTHHGGGSASSSMGDADAAKATAGSTPAPAASGAPKPRATWRLLKRLRGIAPPFARCGHACVHVPDTTTMLVFGGLTAAGTYLNDLHVLDVGSLEWRQPQTTGLPPAARAWHCMAAAPGKVYVYGGQDGARSFVDMWMLDTTSWAWTALPSAAEPPAPGFAVLHAHPSGLLLLLTSPVTSEDSIQVHAFDPPARAWATLPMKGRIPPARTGFSASQLPNGNLVVFGGTNKTLKFSDVHILRCSHLTAASVRRPPRVTWQRLVCQNEPKPRWNHAAVTLGGNMIVFGGRIGRNCCACLLYLDVARAEWAEIDVTASDNAQVPTARESVGFVATASDVIMFGGSAGGHHVANDVFMLTTGKLSHASTAFMSPIRAPRRTDSDSDHPSQLLPVGSVSDDIPSSGPGFGIASPSFRRLAGNASAASLTPVSSDDRKDKDRDSAVVMLPDVGSPVSLGNPSEGHRSPLRSRLLSGDDSNSDRSPIDDASPVGNARPRADSNNSDSQWSARYAGSPGSARKGPKVLERGYSAREPASEPRPTRGHSEDVLEAGANMIRDASERAAVIRSLAAEVLRKEAASEKLAADMTREVRALTTSISEHQLLETRSHQEAQRLSDQLASKRRLVAQREHAAADSDVAVKDMQASVASVTTRLEQRESVRKRHEAASERLQAAVKQLANKLRALEAEDAASNEAARLSQAEVDRLQTLLTERLKQHAAVAEENSQLRIKIAALQAKLHSLWGAKREALAQQDVLNQELTRAHAQWRPDDHMDNTYLVGNPFGKRPTPT